jgi:hypothetical protein
MFSFFKFCFLFAAILIVGWFMLGIHLGDKTLYEHLSGISKTEEAQDLKNEIGKKVDDAASDLKDKASSLAEDRLKEEIEKKLKDKEAKDRARRTEDRGSLDKLIREKSRENDKAEDRAGLTRLIDTKDKEKRSIGSK